MELTREKGGVQLRRRCGGPGVLAQRAKTLMPGQFSCPEQTQENGVPARLCRVGGDALATVDDFVHGKLGL